MFIPLETISHISNDFGIEFTIKQISVIRQNFMLH